MVPSQCRKLLAKVGALLRSKPDPCPKNDVMSVDPDEAEQDLIWESARIIWLKEKGRIPAGDTP